MKQQSSGLTLTDEDMAAEMLLLALFSGIIHAQVIQRAGNYHRFILDRTADFCLISRWSGEEKKIMWNSSQHHNFSLQTEDSYKTSPLRVSDSGQYQVQCWTQNNVTHERNSSLLVCGLQKMREHDVSPYVGQTLELTCDDVGPKQSVYWALNRFNQETKNWEFSLIDDVSSLGYKLQLVKNESSLLVTFDKSYDYYYYYCLEKNHQMCDILKRVFVDVQPEFFHRSVGESLELNCSGDSGEKPHVWLIANSIKKEQSHNHTLKFPSLTLNHTGSYACDRRDLYREFYDLFVCPESDPPALAFFTGGENVTLHCGDWKQPGVINWFMRTNRTEGRDSRIKELSRKDRIYLSDMSLVITNISLEDSGEFRCMISKKFNCVFTYKTLVMFREPEVDHHLVRSLLLSVVILILCGVFVGVWRSRSREQLPVPVEEVEMSDLSPASADEQSETL